MRLPIKPVLVALLIFTLALPALAELDTKFSVDFRDVDIREVCKILAKHAGKSVVTGKSVRGIVTLSLKNIPVGAALDVVTQANGISWCIENNVILVNDPLRLPLRSQYIALHHLEAQLASKALDQLKVPVHISIMHDQNALILRGSRPAIDSATMIITKIDRPHPVFQGRIKVRLDKELIHTFTFQGKPGSKVYLNQEYNLESSDDPHKKIGKFMGFAMTLFSFQLAKTGHLQGEMEIKLTYESLKSQGEKTTLKYSSVFAAPRNKLTPILKTGQKQDISVELIWE